MFGVVSFFGPDERVLGFYISGQSYEQTIQRPNDFFI